MFHRAQEDVGRAQTRPLGFAEIALLRQPRQHDERLRRAHPGLAPAVPQLQGLGDELDFAYAAATELDVEAAAAPGDIAINLFLGATDFLHSVILRRLREDGVAQEIEKARHGRVASRRSTRPQQRLALPVLRFVLVILGGALNLPDEIAVAPVRPQPQVYAIGRAFRRIAGDHLRDAFGDAFEKRFVVDD